MNEPIEIPSAAEKLAGSPPEFRPRTAKEFDEYLWKTETLPRLANCDLPERTWFKVRAWPHKRQGGVFRQCLALCAEVGAIAALVGPRGIGKTTVAAQVILARCEVGGRLPWEYWLPYRKMIDLVGQFKGLYGDFGTTQAESLAGARNALCRASLLVIDEVHECDDMRLKNAILTDILDRRYAGKKDTILISNQTAEEFQATTSDSALSRMSEHGEIIACSWPSYRDRAEQNRPWEMIPKEVKARFQETK